LFSIERHNEIINKLKEAKSISVASLSKQLFVSEATIRRDLDILEKSNIVKRTYGGAVLLEGLNVEIPFTIRETEQKDAKQFIGMTAAGLVKDGDILILDSSSTVLSMVPYLKGKRELSIITNGAKTAIDLGEMLHTNVYCTGGRLRENSLSYIGEIAKNSIENYVADMFFFSCRSLSMENGLTEPNEDEAILRRIMIKNSRRSILLCDSSKFGKSSFVKICELDDIDCLVTDRPLSPAWEEKLLKSNIQLLYASE
jgi:DeoR/GlpR family transcriptional regulator of sugar metabolism